MFMCHFCPVEIKSLGFFLLHTLAACMLIGKTDMAFALHNTMTRRRFSYSIWMWHPGYFPVKERNNKKSNRIYATIWESCKVQQPFLETFC